MVTNKKKKNKGVCHIVALPFTLKKYLKAKEELWKLNYYSPSLPKPLLVSHTTHTPLAFFRVSSIHLPQSGKYNISRGIKKEEKKEEGVLKP